jgi:uncharacterized protein YegL
MRRLPIFILLDVSESMVGDNLRQLQQGLDMLVRDLRTDPHALETVYLSAIVFAGKARTLAPLTELAQFYPPRLPAGSGTSLGAGLNHLMDEIDRGVVGGTAERKGDWRPVVYLMTDGKPTDDIEPALRRWQQKYASRVTLVAIAIGKHASLQTLQRLTDNVLQLDARTEADFKRFVTWVTMSVAAQSRSVAAGGVNLAKTDPTILRKIHELESAAMVDEELAIFTGQCQKNKLPYLMRYERLPQRLHNADFKLNVELYDLTGVYALERDYLDLSDQRAMVRTLNTDALNGAPGCPHCGNSIAFAMCGCGAILCINGPGEATCPSCNKMCNFSASGDEGFDVTRSRG